jgi:hypothetical protein
MFEPQYAQHSQGEGESPYSSTQFKTPEGGLPDWLGRGGELDLEMLMASMPPGMMFDGRDFSRS